MVDAGDVIEYRGKPWAVIELVRAVPHGLPPNALIGRDGETLHVSTAGLSVLATPIWAPGQRVKYPWGHREGTVVRTLGEHVEVTDERERRHSGNSDGKFKQVFLTAIPKGALAHANL